MQCRTCHRGQPRPVMIEDLLTASWHAGGMDSLAALPTWHRPQELIQLCYLAVLKRPGYEADLEALERRVPGVSARVVFIPAPEIEISSHEIQARCRAGQSLHDFVPLAVEQYIVEHRLYGGGNVHMVLRQRLGGLSLSDALMLTV